MSHISGFVLYGYILYKLDYVSLETGPKEDLLRLKYLRQSSCDDP